MSSWIFLPSASRMSPTTTRAPSRAKRIASEAPMPRAPPLISATLPASLVMLLLLGAEEAVARVAQTGHDVAVVVQMAVHRRGVDLNVRMRAVEGGEPFRAGQQAHEADRAWMHRLHTTGRRDGRVAGGEHGIEHDHVALFHLVRDLEVVLDRRERLLIAVQADVTQPRARQDP